MSEVIEAAFYDSNNVRISTTRAVFGSTNYPLANITSVAMVEVPADTGGQGLFMIGGVLILVMGLVVEQWRFLGIGAGALMLLLAWVLYRGAKPSYAVKIGTAGGEQRVYTSADKAEIEKVVSALNMAIDRRG